MEDTKVSIMPPRQYSAPTDCADCLARGIGIQKAVDILSCIDPQDEKDRKGLGEGIEILKALIPGAPASELMQRLQRLACSILAEEEKKTKRYVNDHVQDTFAVKDVPEELKKTPQFRQLAADPKTKLIANYRVECLVLCRNVLPDNAEEVEEFFRDRLSKDYECILNVQRHLADISSCRVLSVSGTDVPGLHDAVLLVGGSHLKGFAAESIREAFIAALDYPFDSARTDLDIPDTIIKNVSITGITCTGNAGTE